MAERDSNGHFKKGHSVKSPGRPAREIEQNYLSALTAELTMERWQGIVRRAIGDALKGVPTARQWLSDYAIGKPPQILELRGEDAILLAQVLKQFQATGTPASAVFEAMLRQLAEADIESGVK